MIEQRGHRFQKREGVWFECELCGERWPEHGDLAPLECQRVKGSAGSGDAAHRETAVAEPSDSARINSPQPAEPASRPLDILLWCPDCGEQHIDAPQPEKEWDNPPHRSHECQFCGTVWRPCDQPTNGVASITTRGARDSFFVGRARQAVRRNMTEDSCWHCGDVLLVPRTRCERCPDECNVEGCQAPGCEKEAVGP